MALLTLIFIPAIAAAEVPSVPLPSAAGFDLTTFGEAPPSTELTIDVPRCSPDPSQPPGGIVICGTPLRREAPPPPPAPADAAAPTARERFDASRHRQCGVVQSAESCFEGWVVYRATF